MDLFDRLLWCVAEHVAGQGHRRQVLHAVRQEAGHCLGRYAAVLALDPHQPLQVCMLYIPLTNHMYVAFHISEILKRTVSRRLVR